MCNCELIIIPLIVIAFLAGAIFALKRAQMIIANELAQMKDENDKLPRKS